MLAENSEIMKKANTAISVMEMSPRDKWLYDSRMKYEHFYFHTSLATTGA